MITHDIDEAIKLGDQVAILRVGGKLAQVGTPQQLLEEPADAFVEGFVGKDRGLPLAVVPAGGGLRPGAGPGRPGGRAPPGEPGPGGRRRRPSGRLGRPRPAGAGDPGSGSTFDPETDTLRTALDSALTSPFGLAVAVAPGTGRFAGVVSAQDPGPGQPTPGPQSPSRSSGASDARAGGRSRARRAGRTDEASAASSRARRGGADGQDAEASATAQPATDEDEPVAMRPEPDESGRRARARRPDEAGCAD